MTTYYLDSSALVKRYAIETGTAWVRMLCEQAELDVDQFVVDEAMDLTGKYRLRGYDAIHLACALRLNRALTELQLPPLILVSADDDLLKAAQGEHLTTENPNEHV